ncbi:ABC transporter ATP-binding protein [Prochlorothrix hollandica]|uniref:ABC transporter ATP-binding protein n=1 Tax=Prochlorothrix hollandica TaxID=1223 RepID=UPI00333FE8E0
MADPMVRLTGISKTFGTKKVLDNVDLDIDRNETLAIIGPSGTGKSTILRIIAGLLAPDEGTVLLDGQSRKGLIEDAADPFRISLVFQQSALFDSLTVEENVGFLLYQHSNLHHDHIHTLVRQSLDRVGLSEEISNLYPAQLSGGMRKRVSFARAIMEDPDHPSDNPELVLYDEPTAGLDPVASTLIEDLMRDVRSQVSSCSTYVVVTHQDSTIRRTADRIILLYQGQVQWQGRVEDIDQSDNPYVRQFFAGQIQGPMQITD